MTTHTILETPKVRLVGLKKRKVMGERPSKPPPPQTPLLHKIFLLPETYLAEPLDLNDILADITAA